MLWRYCLSMGALLLTVASATAEDYRLETITEAPEDVSDQIASVLDTQGLRIIGPRRDLCRIWLVKDIAVQKDFTPTLTVKYPFTPGQLLGVMTVPRRSGLSDFRGQEIEAGVYTLRYGQQPMDGNHIGTSDTADFLLAVPAGQDSDPAPITDMDTLFQKSAEAAGTTHPAIVLLLPAEGDPPAEPRLVNDADREFWILELAGKSGDSQVPLRLVVVGESKG